MRGLRASFLALAVASCSKQPPSGAPPHVAEAAPPSPEVAPDDAGAASATDGDAGSSGATVPVDAGPSKDGGSAPGDAPPNVKVISIGMHVGGGPFDEETKKPFLRSVEPHYAELARCYRYVSEAKQVDAGVDLLIPTEGGKARVSNPRSTVKAEGFLPCVVSFFETISFDRPAKGGPQGLSYSVRFKPTAKGATASPR